uniref:C2H2-type domain-containing protein n=1 Tax=Lygus hesperus TaxID=30085 RepID=A0A0K8TK27_LYGHE
MGFSNKAILAVHKQLLHKNQTLSSGDGLPKVGERSRKKPLICSWCSATFNLKSSLHIHIKVTHPAQKDAFEQQRKEPEKLNCPVCGKTFPKECTLQQHMRSLHGEKPWQCTVCSKTFTTKYFLRKHKRIHTGETPYECGICHKVFTFQQSYHKHMLYHTDNKPYCCSHCGRFFKELSTLNNHERIHSGEKPFSCETCGKSFRQRVSYLVHRRIHTGAMPYKCTACNKSFRYKISQRTHKCPEHPPGVVVKTQISLIDRLQAVISKEEEKLQQTTNQSSNNSDPACSSQPVSSLVSVAHISDQCESISGVKGCHESAENPHSGNGSLVGGTFPGSDDIIHCSDPSSKMDDVTSRSIAPCGPNSAAPSGLSPHEFNLQDMLFSADGSEPITDHRAAFSPSQNLDLSPSECLGRLHISTSNHNSQDSDN